MSHGFAVNKADLTVLITLMLSTLFPNIIRNLPDQTTIALFQQTLSLLPTLAQNKRYRNGMFILLADCRGFVEAQFRHR